MIRDVFAAVGVACVGLSVLLLLALALGELAARRGRPWWRVRR